MRYAWKRLIDLRGRLDQETKMCDTHLRRACDVGDWKMAAYWEGKLEATKEHLNWAQSAITEALREGAVGG